MANILKQTNTQQDQTPIPKRVIVQYYDDVTEEDKQAINNYEDLTVEEKSIFDAYQSFCESKMI